MSYQVDFKKPPKQLLLEMFNLANQLDCTLDQLTFSNVRQSLKPGYNTATDIWWNTTADKIGMVTVNYNRIDLGLLFGLCGLSVKELNVDVVDGVLQKNSRVWAEIERRYGVKLSPDDFSIVDGYLVPKTGNVAYTGQHELAIEWSLATRISSVRLNGFSLIPENDLSLTVDDVNIQSLRWPASMSGDKASAELLTYGIDCSDFAEKLAINAGRQGGQFTYFDELKAALAVYGVPDFSNATSAIPAVDYKTSDYPDANRQYTNVVVVSSVSSAYMTGRLMLHYNV